MAINGVSVDAPPTEEQMAQTNSRICGTAVFAY